MENTSSENDTQQSSPPRRRRSTFFERRNSLAPQPFTENTDPNACKEKGDDDDDNCNEELLKYHDKLLSEKEQWKTEVKERRNKYNDLKQQFQMAVTAPRSSKVPYSSLTKEDIEFLNGKVNISKLVANQQNLHNSVKKTQEFYRRAMELDEVLLSHCEQKVNEVTDYMLQNSTID